jgi:hypothetical protein
MNVFLILGHFQELRFQIDEHREELKNKIDDIALEMIIVNHLRMN